MKLRRIALPALNLVALVVVWELAVRIFRVPEFILPAPTAILAAMVEHAPALWRNSLFTLYESVAGFLLSVLIGVPLAIAIVWSSYLRNTLYPILLLFQSIPKTAIAPLIILWFGYGDVSKIVIAFLVAFFPIVVDTAMGLISADSDALDLVRSLRSTRWQEFVHIRMPHALPAFFSGAKVAITLAVIGAVIGEFVGASNGLGYLILLSTSSLQTALVFACLIILAIQGIALFYLIELIEWLVLPWNRSSSTQAAESGFNAAGRGG